MASEAQKKQINIALVGVRPADQITLKGYLRVLLSLDADLHWLAATTQNIHLFMINKEFRSASSVAKLLETNRGAAVLYIDRIENGDGSLIQNQLTLPLKQISVLHDWLIKNVMVLSGVEAMRSTAQQFAQKTGDSSLQVNKDGSIANLTGIGNAPAGTAAGVPSLSKEFIELIKTCQSRSQSVFEVVGNNQSIAIIDTKRQLVWERMSSPKLSGDLRLRVFGGQVPDVKFSKDAGDWLWQLALKDSRVVLPLLNFTQKYQMRYWAKPPMGGTRRELLAVMTAMEKKPLIIDEIAERASVSVEVVQKVVAALLFSGNLMPEVYDKIEAKVMAMPEVPVMSVAPPVPPVTQKTAAQEQEKEEKMGFLARLRKKLGL